MKRIFLSILGMIVSILAIAQPSPVSAEPRFRNPINTYKQPPVSTYYDNRAGSGVITWRCDATSYEAHKGTDFRADIGTPVYASASGVLYERTDSCSTWGGWGNPCGGYFGNHVRIAHSYPYNASAYWITISAHLSQGTANVRGQSSLNCGSWVGNSGSSGSSTGPHLHYEVKSYGSQSDPFAGACSRPVSFWVNQNGGLPTTQCQ